MRKCVRTLLPLVALAASAVVAAAPPDDCVTCHSSKTPGLHQQWVGSKHAENGVGCIDCHRAEPDDRDGFVHFGESIATLVTPRDCGHCHEQEAAEVGGSFHATAGQILDSQDAYLAHVTAGNQVAILGCENCHGARVSIDPSSENRLSRSSWPNSGIGRINPDGSLGSCTACHTRHSFSKAQARQPEACSKCHLGPDHPQKEIYEESKHGNTYFTSSAGMNLGSETWIAGVDYSAAPTCATCHMAAAPGLKRTHDVGQRISWTLRPPVSTRKDHWESKRASMEKVCGACHVTSFTRGHFYQFDASVRLYNEKFANPATAIMNLVRSKGLLENPAAFSNRIEWTYWELWHHEGRRARHGAAMMGPDYTWWNGFYEVAQNFYFELIPEARQLHDPDVDALISALLNGDPMHRWVRQETADLKKQIRTGELQKIYSRFFSE